MTWVTQDVRSISIVLVGMLIARPRGHWWVAITLVLAVLAVACGGEMVRFEDGIWSRKDDGSAFVFTNKHGEQIKLDAGQTWIHVIPTDWTVTSR